MHLTVAHIEEQKELDKARDTGYWGYLSSLLKFGVAGFTKESAESYIVKFLTQRGIRYNRNSRHLIWTGQVSAGEHKIFSTP